MTDPLKDLVRRSQNHRDSGKKEKMAREDFVSFLRAVFPGESWVDHFVEGAETTVATGQSTTGRKAVGFVDTLVRATAIEYERDIRIAAVRRAGLGQLRTYCASLVASGTPISLVRAVLSDFVEWEVYEPKIVKRGSHAAVTADDIDLGSPVDGFNVGTLAPDNEDSYKSFLRAHLGREESRALTADHLAADFGYRSGSSTRLRPQLESTVVEAVGSDTAASVAAALWTRFIDHLESGGSDFRPEHYAAELYFCLLARLLAANVLAGRALRSDDSELEEVITGEFFSSRFRLGNFVERDYFGWVLQKDHLGSVLPTVRSLQRDLTAYNYAAAPTSELFGPLIGQLCEETERRLLGQASTPAWLARHIAARCLNALADDERPQFADMCCGSGSIMCEVIRAHRSFNPGVGLDEVVEAVTGFDVDPLAVTFAKTTWVIAVRDLLEDATRPVHIPVYHADSLFVAAPTAKGFPGGEGADDFPVELDGKTVKLPTVLIEPAYRGVFDAVVDWAYDNALRASEDRRADHITADRASRRLDAALAAAGVTLETATRAKAAAGVYKLAVRMAEIAMAGRNGIWAFVLKNAYRPSLLAGHFNGIVSNPPWLALSRIRNNPYRDRITVRTKSYGLKPKAESFLHLEIGTTFLMYAVDRYLKPGGVVGVVLPAAVAAGNQHEPFRSQAHRRANRPVPLKIDEFWIVGDNAFNMPGAVVIGRKEGDAGTGDLGEVRGFVATAQALVESRFFGGGTGKHTAWSVGKEPVAGVLPVAPGHSEPEQGADLMPRRAVAITVADRRGAEVRVRTPRPGDPEFYVVGKPKRFGGMKFDGFVAPQYLFSMVQSLSVVPFAVNADLPTIAVPAARRGGRLVLVSDEDLQAQGFRETAKRFRAIDNAYKTGKKGSSFRAYIDTRGKLAKQALPAAGHLVLHPASGSNAAAAVFKLSPASACVLIDQTLYWHVAASEDEAYYLAGVLNSRRVAGIIKRFMSKGNFGPRHFHELPWQVVPPYSSADLAHRQIAVLAKAIAGRVEAFVSADADLRDPGKWITMGRKRVWTFLSAADEMDQLNALANGVL